MCEAGDAHGSEARHLWAQWSQRARVAVRGMWFSRRTTLEFAS